MMIPKVLDFVSSILYVIYAYCGLLLLLLSFVHPADHWIRQYAPSSLSWSQCVYLLASANVIHSIHQLGPLRAASFHIHSILICVFFEELGLRTGLIFGEYEFTHSLGIGLSPRLPCIIPALWLCLVYPSFLLGLEISRNIFPRASQLHFVFIVSAMSSAVLTGFDVVSEPMAVLYGNEIWHHMARIDPNPLTYSGIPDWRFFSSSKVESQNMGAVHSLLSNNAYYGVPIQNFLGWVLTGMVIYVPISTLLLSQPCCRLKKRSSLSMHSRLSFKLSEHLPALVCIFAHQIFYLLHPIHPIGVRAASAIYLLFLSFTTLLV